VLGIIAVAAGAGLWLPTMHLFFARDVEDYFAEKGVASESVAGRMRQRLAEGAPARLGQTKHLPIQDPTWSLSE